MLTLTPHGLCLLHNWVAPTRATKHGLSRSLPDPASDCTATCILAFGYFLNAILVYA